jgi:hypothetical protein
MTLPDETSVAMAGDWHGNETWIGQAIAAIARVGGIQTILHLGDFGIGKAIGDRKIFDQIDKLCARVGIERILVTPGNHEDWGYLDELFSTYPGQLAPLSASVFALPRGYRFILAGRSFLSFGGAASIDYEMRKPGVDWFLTELPTEKDVTTAIAGGHTDVLLLHETVNGGTQKTEQQVRRNPLGWSAEALTYSARSRELATRVWNAVEPRVLVHGHMHIADEIDFDDGRRVISVGCDNQEKNLGILGLPDLSWEWMTEPADQPRPRRTLNFDSQYLWRPDEH